MYYIVGIILLVVGIVINTAINRRRFYRRGPGGLQHYRTYSGAVSSRFIEGIGKIIAIILILLGLASLLTGYSVDKQKEEKKREMRQNKTTTALRSTAYFYCCFVYAGAMKQPLGHLRSWSNWAGPQSDCRLSPLIDYS